MKKLIVTSLAALLLFGGIATVHAANVTCNRACQQQACFIDDDNDGICDNRGSNRSNCSGNGQSRGTGNCAMGGRGCGRNR